MKTENPLTKAQRLVGRAKAGLTGELRLIASANYASPEVKKSISDSATDLFAEGSVGKRYVGGSESYDEVEKFAIETAKDVFHAITPQYNIYQVL